jgi:hypothetical protein
MSRELRQALEQVASRVREVRLWASLAVCWLVWTLVGASALALGARSWPVVMSGLGLAVLSGLACIGLALRSGRDLRPIARRIEARHPDLDASLLTAVEQTAPNPLGRLGFLQEAVVSRVLDHRRTHDWRRVVPASALVGLRMAHAASLVAFLAVSLVLVNRARSDLSRPGLPLVANAKDPVGIEVTPGHTEIEKGTPLLVVARFPRSSIPAEARLVVDAGSTATTGMSRSLEDPAFAGRVDSVTSDLTYRVEFTGGRSEAFRVHVFEYPELTRADARLTFPDYTGMEPKVVEDARHVTAVEGTRAELLFLNKEVASAELTDEQGTPVAIERVAGAGGPAYRALLTLADSRRLKLQLVDQEGRPNKLPAEFRVNVTRNAPPRIVVTQPGRDLRVSPLEELWVKGQVTDDFGVVRMGMSITHAGGEPQDVVLEEPASGSARKQVPLEHLISLEALAAEPDQLLSYYVWAEDTGPDGKPRRTDGDMFFAEVRPFEEIFRQGENSPGGSAEQSQQQGGPQSAGEQQAEELAELQKQIINATWTLIRRETGTSVTEAFGTDATLLRESQDKALAQAGAMEEQLQDRESKARLDTARKAMSDASRELATAAGDPPSAAPLRSALAAEQAAYQALLKLRAREFEVSRSRSRQSQRGQSARAASRQRQLDQLDLSEDPNRFEEQSRAQPPASQREQEAQESRQVANRLKELARRQEDLNERLKEMQSALEAAQDEAARQEIERQLKRLRDQQQEILRDMDETQERMENAQNRERMTEARDKVQEARDRAQQASEALDQGRVSQALTEGTRAGETLNEVRDDLRKQSAGAFAEDLTEMRQQARQLDETQDRLTEQLDAWKQDTRPTLREPEGRQQLGQDLQRQQSELNTLLDRMRETVGEAETTEPLLARSLFEAARQADQQSIGQSLDQARRLADAGFSGEASDTSRQAGQSLDQLREGVERAARSVLGDETSALKRARDEVDDLADQVNREIARNSGEPQPPQDGAQPTSGGGEGQESGQEAQQRREGASEGQEGQTPNESQPPGQGRGQQAGEQGQQAGEQGQQAGEQGQQTGEQQGQQPGQGRQPGQGGRGGQPNAEVPGNEGRAGDADRSRAGQPGRPGGGRQSALEQLLGGGPEQAAPGDDPGGPISGGGFREWSDRMRDVEELLEDPELRADAARIRDRVRGAREELRRHAKTPDWTGLRELVSDPIVELRQRIEEEIQRRESPDALVPIDRDPVPPRFAEGVRRYYERLGSGR